MLHNGRELTADDVVASLQRWMDVAARQGAGQGNRKPQGQGRQLAFEIVLKAPYAPLLSQLALPSGMAAIMAKESIASPLKDFVGTGPYKFKERRPDQFVLLTRFDKYSRARKPASGYGGKREASPSPKSCASCPCPTPTRASKARWPASTTLPTCCPPRRCRAWRRPAARRVPIMTPSFGFPLRVQHQGRRALANQPCARPCRPAMGEGEMLAAGFGDTRFFTAEANHFPKGSPFYSTAGADQYNERNAAKAKDAAAKAGYKGEPIRISPAASTTSTTTCR
jgi:peptide/nickel transport system substrate-binding protein